MDATKCWPDLFGSVLGHHWGCMKPEKYDDINQVPPCDGKIKGAPIEIMSSSGLAVDSPVFAKEM